MERKLHGYLPPDLASLIHVNTLERKKHRKKEVSQKHKFDGEDSEREKPTLWIISKTQATVFPA